MDLKLLKLEKKEDSEEEKGGKNGRNDQGDKIGLKDEMKGKMGYFGALSDDEIGKDEENGKDEEFEVHTIWHRGIEDKEELKEKTRKTSRGSKKITGAKENNGEGK